MKFAQGRTSQLQQQVKPVQGSAASAALQQSARQQQQASQLKAILHGSQQLIQRKLPEGAVSQQAALEDEEALQGKFETAQLMELEEEPLQGKFETIQQASLEEEEPLQGKFEPAVVSQRQAEARTANNTGMPDQLKVGIENLSGYAMDDVKVHYNSAKPAAMQAHAYAQGTDIHIAPGQEQHLPHEAWHVVQQKQGRVQATTQLKGEAINDDPGLEHEADVMGDKALRINPDSISSIRKERIIQKVANKSLQLKWLDSLSDILKWDIPIQGVRWYFNKLNGLMFYIVENNNERFKAHSGEENAKQRDEWVKLYGSDPLADEDASVVPDDEVFSDSDSDSEDPAFDGLRIKKVGTSGGDLAEFDRVKFKRGKIYEDKLATFDQSKRPPKHRQPESELVSSWIEKQVLGKVSSKLTVIQNIDGEKTIRCHEKTSESPEVILNWFKETRRFKVVVFGESLLLRNGLENAIRKLRIKFPDWRITAKLGDPRAREDHDKMHK